MTGEDIIRKVDWNLLKEQKSTLCKLVAKTNDDVERDHLSGIISFIDIVQDYAVDTLGVDEKKVFKLNDY